MPEEKQDLGRKGEEATLEYYLKRGYRLIEKNWRIRQGELDLVLQKQDTLVFVEVKTSDSFSSFRAIENITQRKQEKLKLLAELYLSTQLIPAKIQQVRIDGAEVTERGGSFEVQIFENIIN